MKTLPIYLLTHKRKFAAGFVEVERLKRLANEIVSFTKVVKPKKAKAA